MQLTSKIPRRIISNLSPQKHSLGLPLFKHIQHLFQGETAAHIRIQHEQPLRISRHNSISKVIQPTSGPQRSVLA